MRRAVVAVLAIQASLWAVTGPVATAQAAPTPVAGTGNPWGVNVVRFAPGTTPAAMNAAVRAASGTVTNDLSKIGALGVVSTNKSFATQIRANRNVRGLWVDRVYSMTDPDTGPATAGGTAAAAIGGQGPQSPPDPLHDATSFNGETNPEGILQWDDNRMNVPSAWTRSTGDHSVVVAVLDTGVDFTHKELAPNVDRGLVANTIPCRFLALVAGPALDSGDCAKLDNDGHGTWVASRIAGAVNGFGSNGIAPNVTVIGYKVLSTTIGGGLTSWIVDGMLRACDAGADVMNMSIGGYDTTSPADADDYFLWLDAVRYCRARGTAIFASAGNEHVRVNRANLTLTGATGRVEALIGAGQVDAGNEGIASAIAGEPIEDFDARGLLEVPAGVPGVVMVSATNNAIGAAGADVPANVRWPAPKTGARDQLTYYSSYGSRIDITAPGGARKFNIPRSDGGPGDILFGGWGTVGALVAHGEICEDPALGGPLTFSCFLLDHYAFGWLQGTSMSSPNATGVAALALSSNHALQGRPDDLIARLKATARTNMVNFMGPNDPLNTAPDYSGTPCTSGFCHVDFTHPISFADAYGAGMVNAAAALG